VIVVIGMSLETNLLYNPNPVSVQRLKTDRGSSIHET
jgi:hypothetical protein